jgi:putative two-component system response regulator
MKSLMCRANISWEGLGDINILVVEDDPFNQLLVKSLLGKFPQIHILEAYDGIEALETLQGFEKIDIILLDLHMPNMNGYEFLNELKNITKLASIPSVFVMTTDEDEKKELYAKGADGFISKPFNIEELEVKIYQTIKLNQNIEKDTKIANGTLAPIEKVVSHSTDDIESSQRDFFCRLIALKSKSEAEDKLKIQIISSVAKEFSLIVGYDLKIASDIYCAAQVRDIGLIGFSQNINANIKFTERDKYNYGQYIFCGYQMMISHIDTDFLKITKKVILEYREAYDGSGVPYQLKGSQISKKAMIVAMAETFEALLSKREYREKESYSPQETYDIFKSESGKRFSPKLTTIFLKNFYFFIKLRKSIILKRSFMDK